MRPSSCPYSTYGGFVSLLYLLQVNISPLVPITNMHKMQIIIFISQDHYEIQKKSMYYFSGL